jgi:hypothetical protein
VNRFALPLLLALPVVTIACGGENLTLPSDGEPAKIAVLSGNDQRGRVGTALTELLVVQVTDSRDRPVAGASVVFEFADQASGTASPGTVTSDADGKASSQLQLGSSVGSLTGRVHVPVDAGTVPVEATFTAIALSDDANGIAAVSGQDQSGPVSTALKDPLVVRVTDKFGNPISGVEIAWAAAGGGSVSQPSSVSDADGRASVTRTLGPNSGPQSTSATAGDLAGSPVVFNHTATAGAASRIEKTGGDGQSAVVGSELPNPVQVRVLDAANNPISGRAVAWVVGAGGGSVTPTSSTTDQQGRTSATWTLGGNPGNNTLNAVVSGVGTATFSATATAGTPSTTTTTVRASPSTITAGGSPSTVTVTVKDAAGNPVSDVAVTLSSSGTGNQIDPATATSNGSGVATFTFGSTVAESKTITATVGGATVNQTATVTVQKVSSVTKIESDEPDASIVGEKVTVVFTVTGTGGTPSGNVTVTVQGGDPTETCTATVAAGSCDITFNTPGNNRRLTATYGGDSQFAGSSDNENHRVNAAPPPENKPPVAVDDAYSGSRVAILTVADQGSLLTSNDQDPDNDPLSAVAETKATTEGGAVSIAQDGSFTYAPPVGGTEAATDTFDYTVTDGRGGSDVGTATITFSD